VTRLDRDAAALGLTTTTVAGAAGTIVARHRARGSSRATVMLHGAAGDWSTFTPLLASVTEPVLLDLPGFGEAALTEGATLDDVCALISDTADTLGYDDWDLVGHSMGGFLALQLAVAYPERTRSVGVISPTGFSVIESVRHPLRRFFVLPAFTMLWGVMRLMRTGAIVRLARRLGVLRLAVFPLFRHPFAVDATVVNALADDVRPRAFTAATEFVRDYDLGAWAQIVCPVAAVQGDRDVFARASDLARLKELLPGATTTVIPDCGHFANVEKPEEVARLLGALRA
jgi:pimeloyl-ACP methyl ester carboxylesterase